MPNVSGKSDISRNNVKVNDFSPRAADLPALIRVMESISAATAPHDCRNEHQTRVEAGGLVRAAHASPSKGAMP